MDHSNHGGSAHSLMDMGDGSGHGGMKHGDGGGMTDMCSMNMLFTWSTDNLCVVFKWWHVRTSFDLLVTLAAVVLLGMGYEYTKVIAAKLEAKSNSAATLYDQSSLLDQEELQDCTISSKTNTYPDPHRLQRALVYCFQVFYSFFLMLVFMTYNGWLMVAVTFGAFLGYYIWGYRQPSRRDLSCH